MKYPFLSENEIVRIRDLDDSMFSVLTDSFMQPCWLTSLKRFQLECVQNCNINIRPFFDALFSRPKEQLAELTLQLVEVRNLSQQDIVDSWKSNSRGQKLKKFVEYILLDHLIV